MIDPNAITRVEDKLQQVLNEFLNEHEKTFWEDQKQKLRKKIYTILTKKKNRFKTVKDSGYGYSADQFNALTATYDPDTPDNDRAIRDNMNMWELCHEIAERCGLGFSAMEKCKDEQERIPIISGSLSYEKVLERYAKRFGGERDDVLYDVWIDFYNNLVLVDKYAALNDNVDSSQLGMYAEVGVPFQGNNLLETKHELTRRMVTNHNMLGVKANLEIDEYWEFDKMPTLDKGTLNTQFFFSPIGSDGGQNSYKPLQVGIMEDSRDGAFTEDYQVSKASEWVWAGNGSLSQQTGEFVRQQLDEKLGMHTMTILLKEPNFALQRGQLITVVIEEFDRRAKTALAKNASVFSADDNRARDLTPDKNPTVDNIPEDTILLDESIGIVNPTKSGIYYIDGISYDYQKSDEGTYQPRIQQYLILLRRGAFTSLFNQSTTSKLGDPSWTKNEIDEYEEITDYQQDLASVDASIQEYNEGASENATEGTQEYVTFYEKQNELSEGIEYTSTEASGMVIHVNGQVNVFNTGIDDEEKPNNAPLINNPADAKIEPEPLNYRVNEYKSAQRKFEAVTNKLADVWKKVQKIVNDYVAKKFECTAQEAEDMNNAYLTIQSHYDRTKNLVMRYKVYDYDEEDEVDAQIENMEDLGKESTRLIEKFNGVSWKKYYTS